MLIDKSLKDIQYANGGIAKVMNENKVLWEKKSTVKVKIEMDCVGDGIYKCEISLGGEKYELRYPALYGYMSSQDLELDLNKVLSNNIKVYVCTTDRDKKYSKPYLMTNRGGWASSVIYLSRGYRNEGDANFDVSKLKPKLQAGDVLTIKVNFE